jgi:hypothetical protein
LRKIPRTRIFRSCLVRRGKLSPGRAGNCFFGEFENLQILVGSFSKNFVVPCGFKTSFLI